MTTTDCDANVEGLDTNKDPDPGSPASEERASKSLKVLFFGFAATVTVGLGLTIWYLGVRIVAADAAAPASAAQPRVSALNVNPTPPPVFYLEMPALGPKQDSVFVRSLEAKGLHAQVQTPDAGEARILIGPFETPVDLEQAQRKLQADGVLAMEASH